MVSLWENVIKPHLTIQHTVADVFVKKSTADENMMNLGNVLGLGGASLVAKVINLDPDGMHFNHGNTGSIELHVVETWFFVVHPRQRGLVLQVVWFRVNMESFMYSIIGFLLQVKGGIGPCRPKKLITRKL